MSPFLSPWPDAVYAGGDPDTAGNIESYDGRAMTSRVNIDHGFHSYADGATGRRGSPADLGLIQHLSIVRDRIKDHLDGGFEYTVPGATSWGTPNVVRSGVDPLYQNFSAWYERPLRGLQHLSVAMTQAEDAVTALTARLLLLETQVDTMFRVIAWAHIEWQLLPQPGFPYGSGGGDHFDSPVPETIGADFMTWRLSQLHSSTAPHIAMVMPKRNEDNDLMGYDGQNAYVAADGGWRVVAGDNALTFDANMNAWLLKLHVEGPVGATSTWTQMVEGSFYVAVLGTMPL